MRNMVVADVKLTKGEEITFNSDGKIEKKAKDEEIKEETKSP